MPDQRDRLLGLELEVDPEEDRPARLVAERDILEAHPAGPCGQRAGAGPVADLLGLVEDLEDPLARGGRPLALADPHPEHPQREDRPSTR